MCVAIFNTANPPFTILTTLKEANILLPNQWNLKDNFGVDYYIFYFFVEF